VTPKRRIIASVISMYGFEMSSPTTSMIAGCPVLAVTIGSAINKPVKNCDEASPRIGIGRSMAIWPPPMVSGGKPGLPV